jgi:hypothetical protein
MIIAICYMPHEQTPFEKIKCDSVTFKKNGVKELIKKSEVFCKMAQFVKVKIKSLR